MADLEKVIKAWECCHPFNRQCDKCPYDADCYHDEFCRDAISDMVELLKEKQGISVDAFLQWCIESHRMGDASRKGIEYWINEFKTWKQNGKDEEKQPKKGEWIERENASGDLYYDCSVCGKSWVLNDGTPKENGMNYCPCCGADMRKDGDSDASMA